MEEDARYLGNHVNIDGKNKETVRKRVEAVNERLFALAGFWGNKEVPQGLKVRVSKTWFMTPQCLEWRRRC